MAADGMVFDLNFQQAGQNVDFTATWVAHGSDSVSLGGLFSALGCDVTQIPPGFRGPNLASAGLSCNRINGNRILVVYAKTAEPHALNMVFAYLGLGSESTPVYAGQAAIDIGIGLADNLPLIGGVLGSDDDLRLDYLGLAFLSGALKKEQIQLLNQAINAVNPSLPQFNVHDYIGGHPMIFVGVKLPGESKRTILEAGSFVA